MQGWSTDVAVPQAWRSSDRDTAGIARRVLDGLDQIVPGVAGSSVELVDAGVVVAWGSTDIDHADSRFHERFAVGVTEDDGYFSVDTGELTCAPRFADELARRLQ
jgi:hypothetical protein